MKKVHLLTAVAALALVGCANDDYVGQAGNPQENGGAIMFQSKGMASTRADNKVGADAAAILGNNFIVEGVKVNATDAAFKTGEVVFDNYLVGWKENTAGTSADNTNDWAYVGLESGTTNCETATWTALHPTGTAQVQTLKYWDYSKPAYMFVAYSTGARKMVTTDPVASTSVKVTRINNENLDGSDSKYAYQFTAKNAPDFAQCYYTDVTPVKKGATTYGQPVTLTFKNLSAKVRVGLYETIPGYAVKSVTFYAVDDDNTPTDLATCPTEEKATLIAAKGKSFPEEGTITVTYPATAAEKGTNGDNWNRADVTVKAGSTSTTTTKEFGTLNYVANEDAKTKLSANDYLGVTLPNATFAGTAADNYYKYVIPTSGENDALTLRVCYVLESIDGSGEKITVHGAKAVVPATYTAWKSNYAYTYIFKISDNTNGWTSTDPSDPDGLFPITFDAVVESINDEKFDQTTVTTVATPSITTYQYGHTRGQNYKAGSDNIYVQVMDNTTAPAQPVETLAAANCTLYTLANNKITEADVMSALNIRETEKTTSITGRNNVVLTATAEGTLKISDADTEIPFKDGVTKKPGNKAAAYFTPAAGTYAFVYDFTPTSPAPTPDYVYTYVGTIKDSAWAADTYYTKDANNEWQVAASWASGTKYYKKYTDNKKSYAVKVIVVE